MEVILDNLLENHNVIQFPLSYSFRCAKKIVKHSQLVYENFNYSSFQDSCEIIVCQGAMVTPALRSFKSLKHTQKNIPEFIYETLTSRGISNARIHELSNIGDTVPLILESPVVASLNPRQRDCISTALSACLGRLDVPRIQLVHGPPGN